MPIGLADLLRIRQELGFYGAGGGRPSLGTDIGQGLTNLGQGLSVAGQGIEKGQDIYAKRLQTAPIGQFFGVPSSQDEANIKQLFAQKQATRVPENVFPQPESQSPLPSGIQGPNPAPVTPQPTEQLTPPPDLRAQFQQKWGISPETPTGMAMAIAPEMQKMQLAPLEIAYKQSETLRNMAMANKLLNPPQNQEDLKGAVASGYASRDFVKTIFPDLKEGQDISIGELKQRVAGGKESETVRQRQENEQNTLWDRGVKALTTVRGDKSLLRTETQRDAAAILVNRLNELQSTGKPLTSTDYADLLAQAYVARTGGVLQPSIEQQMRQDTAGGDFGKWWRYMTGQTMPATSQDVIANLKDIGMSMGKQADIQHEGYMQSRGSKVLPPNLKPELKQQLLEMHRGLSFADQTQNSVTPSTTPQVTSSDFDISVKNAQVAIKSGKNPEIVKNKLKFAYPNQIQQINSLIK